VKSSTESISWQRDVLFVETKNMGSYLKKKMKDVKKKATVLSFDKRNEGTLPIPEVFKLLKHVPRLSFCFLYFIFIWDSTWSEH
jgi:hypothetical protein